MNTNTDTSVNHHQHEQQDLVVPALRNAIPFQKDVIVTCTGSSVTERRGTAWVADTGIGALAYSGKLMTPKPIPDLVGQVMRRAQQTLELLMSDTGSTSFFDRAL